MSQNKVTYSVALEPADFKTLESQAKARDLPTRIYMRVLLLKAIRENGGKGP